MNHFQKYLAEEFAEDYVEGRITRREALRLIVSVTGSVVVANSILAACAPLAENTTPGAGETQAGTTPGNQVEVPLTGATDTSPPQPSATPGAADTAEMAGSPTAGTTETPMSATQPAETEPSGAQYGTVSPDDPAVAAQDVTFTGEDGAEVMAYLAQPAEDGTFPVILVCHENRGLTDHIRDVARRLAKAGYVALAVDLLSRSGGTQAVGSDQVPGVLGNTNPDQFVQDFRAGWQYLGTLPFTQPERVGMVGFCFGGGVTWRVATQMPELKAAAPYYGPHPPVADVPNIQAAVLAIYGGLDTRINSGIPEIEAAMQENGKIYEKVIYPDADHAFHNDTGGRYHAESARDAWMRTIAWFQQYV